VLSSHATNSSFQVREGQNRFGDFFLRVLSFGIGDGLLPDELPLMVAWAFSR